MSCPQEPSSLVCEPPRPEVTEQQEVVTLASADSRLASRSYWDIYTDDQIPVLERAIGGALLPVALVAGFFGAGCGSEEPVRPPNQDNDHIPDEQDNCPEVTNYEQNDTDGDGLGNACDNCKQTPNIDQANRDGDAYGDACDVCPTLYSETRDNVDVSQWDTDRDGIGNGCDDDFDNDGVENDDDNCNPSSEHSIWASQNHDQVDTDNDGIGDACEDEDRSSNSNTCPQIAINSAGDIVTATYHSESFRSPRLGTSSSEAGLKLYLYPSGGGFQEITVKDWETGDNPQCTGRKALDINDNGHVVICWAESTDVYCRGYDFGTGTPTSPPSITVRDIDFTPCFDRNTTEQYAVGLSDTGSFVMAWDVNDEESVCAEAEGEVKAQIFDNRGTPITDQILVGEGHWPSLAVRSGGDFAVAWDDGSSKVQKFGSDGTPAGNTFQRDNTYGDPPSVAWNGSGDLVLGHRWGNFDYLGGVTLFPSDNSSSNTYVVPRDLTDDLFSWQPISYTVTLTNQGNVALAGYQTWTVLLGARFVVDLGRLPGTEEPVLLDSQPSPLFPARSEFAMDGNDSVLMGVHSYSSGTSGSPSLVTLQEWSIDETP